MTMHLRHLGRGLAALGIIAPLALSSCNNDPQDGGLIIRYSFAPGVSCDMDQEMVMDVRVNVGEDGSEATQSIICDNAGGEINLLGVSAGSYDLFVLGVDGDGDAVLDNRGGDTSDDRVEIIGGGTQELNVTLGLAPGRLEVALVVNNNGFPAQCASDEITIKGLRAQAWDFDSSEQLKSHDFDLCEFDGFEPVPDMEREINGRRFDAVVVQALDDSDRPVGSPIELRFDEPVGAGKAAQVSVVCDGDTCEAQVLGGDPGTPTRDPTDGDTTDGGDPTGGGDSTSGGGDDGSSGG